MAWVSHLRDTLSTLFWGLVMWSYAVYARQGDFDADAAVSNTFELEWPRGSGVIVEFPEIDEAAWKTIAEARTLLTKSQAPFLDRLVEHLAG